MLLQRVRFPSFLQLSSIPLCKCTTATYPHSATEGYLGCFPVLAIVANAAMNVFWGFFRYVPRSRITGSEAVSFLIFFLS